MSMTNMKMSAKESKTVLGMSPESDAPAYPYGLTIELNDETMKKLGISELPEVGDEFTMTAKVTVSRASMNDSQEGGKMKSASLQITDMALVDADESSDTASKIYGE